MAALTRRGFIAGLLGSAAAVALPGGTSAAVPTVHAVYSPQMKRVAWYYAGGGGFIINDAAKFIRWDEAA